MVMAGVSVFLAIYSLHLYHLADEQQVPDWVARLTRFARSFSFLCRKKQQVHPTKPPAGHVHMSANGDREKVMSNELDNLSELSQVEVITWITVATTYDSFFFYLYSAAIVSISLGFTLVLIS